MVTLFVDCSRQMRRRQRCAFVGVCLVGLSLLPLAGCSGGKGENTPPAKTGSAIPAPVASQSHSKPITEEEAKQFADAVTASMQQNDAAAQFNKLVDWNAVVDKAVSTPESPQLDKGREGFKRGVIQKIGQGGLGSAIQQTVKGGGSYKFLRAKLNEKAPYVEFRLMPNEGGLNYHKFYLVRRPDGSVVATDMYVMMSGENMSDTLHRGWLPLAVQQMKSLPEKLLSSTDPMLTHQEDLLKFTGFIRAKQWKPALEVYGRFPEAMRSDKNILMMSLAAAQQGSEEEYGRILETYRKAHPNSPELDMLQIDELILRMEFDQALACIDRVIKSQGADGMLLTMRSNILLQHKRIQEAVTVNEEAIASEPDLQQPWSAGLDIALAANDFDKTVRHLDTLEKKFGFVWKDLHGVPEFAEFLKTPQFVEWQARHTKPEGGVRAGVEQTKVETVKP